ncbi:putative signal transduction protein with CBS domains [Solidesulfovibrio fructosivorans JJ]]|uniref:Putative signal transduction protein with CBS domains n=1 Tax=Solidesulfovibrio fructosivorans JJ] TaxID=596151 RepID=E1K1L8_SOLFR|nr:CBS domain-containing protein [Solidesulfovibrio fructosivorans]EFL49512.1 putative signal transduction protein with CBS domains [Solidesulfovibrio fructosivorans JJ]]
MLVADLMTSQLRCLRESDSLADAIALMQELFVRHIPITDADGQLAGLVTQRDLLSLENKKDPVTALRDVMCTDLVTVAPDTSLRAAAETMIYNKFGCLPVVEDGRLVGIITETDFLKLAIFPIAPRRDES